MQKMYLYRNRGPPENFLILDIFTVQLGPQKWQVDGVFPNNFILIYQCSRLFIGLYNIFTV